MAREPLREIEDQLAAREIFGQPRRHRFPSAAGVTISWWPAERGAIAGDGQGASFRRPRGLERGRARAAPSRTTAYDREYRVEIAGKPPLDGLGGAGASAAIPAEHNPEDLLVAALSACHLLSYLALCARAGIEVASYEDQASGLMAIKSGRMRFTEVTLAPRVTIAAGDLDKAVALHEAAHRRCSSATR